MEQAKIQQMDRNFFFSPFTGRYGIQRLGIESGRIRHCLFIIFYCTSEHLSPFPEASLWWNVGLSNHSDAVKGLAEIVLKNDFGERVRNDDSLLLFSLGSGRVDCYALVLSTSWGKCCNNRTYIMQLPFTIEGPSSCYVFLCLLFVSTDFQGEILFYSFEHRPLMISITVSLIIYLQITI